MTDHIILERRMYCYACRSVQPHVVSKYDEQDGFVDVLAVCERKFYESSKFRKTEICGHENFMKMKKSNWEALCKNQYL